MDTISDIVVYENGEIELKVSLKAETIWLTQKQLAELFNVTKQNISLHINNILKEKELDKNSTVKFFLIVQKEGNRDIKRNVEHYNLDMIISIGYRVNSLIATKFRQWATSVLKNYIQNGYTINTHKITEQRLYMLENDMKIIKSHIKNNRLEIKQGIFFNGQIFDAYVLLSDLIKSAKVSIILIDNYIDESILNLFLKNQKIKFIIYTQNISKQLKLDVQKYNKQYTNLELKITKKLHDRFLICDDTVYHFGASFKDLGNKIFAINKMNILAKDLVKNL